MRRHSGWIATAALLAGALAACSGAGAASRGASTSTPVGVVRPSPAPDVSSMAAAPSTTPTGPTGQTGQTGRGSTSRPITLAFGGDVNFAGHPDLLRDHGLDALRPLLGNADVAMVNLETAITDRGTPQPKLYHFRTSPQALVTLQQAGVDGVSLANNHAVDYGPDGLTDTLAARATSPIPVIGVGRDADDAFAPAVFTVRGISIAVLASTQVLDYTVTTFPATASRPGVAGNLSNARLLQAVAAARARDDVVVVFLHWGTDYTLCPDAAQQRTVRDLEAAGVDVVVGGHAHRVQGTGWHGRTFVGFGLGNFVWLNSRGAVDTYSGVLTVSIDPARVAARAGEGAAARTLGPSLVTAGAWTSLVVGADGVPAAPTRVQQPGVEQELASAQSCSGLSQTSS